MPSKDPGEEETQEVTSSHAAAEEIRRWKLQNWLSALELDGLFTQGQKKKQKSPPGVVQDVLRVRERRSWKLVLGGSEHLHTLTSCSTIALIGAKATALDSDKQQKLSSSDGMKSHSCKKPTRKHLCSIYDKERHPWDNVDYAGGKMNKTYFLPSQTSYFFSSEHKMYSIILETNTNKSNSLDRPPAQTTICT